ncbi:MAG TPA: S1 RNA-binding domain-containing protein [Thermoanaerobaculia bacterium]|nr:S1 RNA-binding domain-containing protein [Thermoanaerobaculia bacterium]
MSENHEETPPIPATEDAEAPPPETAEETPQAPAAEAAPEPSAAPEPAVAADGGAAEESAPEPLAEVTPWVEPELAAEAALDAEPAPEAVPEASQPADPVQAAEVAPAAEPASEPVAAEEPSQPEAPAEPAAAVPEEPAAMPTDPVALRLLEAIATGTPVQGKVFGWNQGGYHVLIDGLLAFCPRSEIDLGNPKAPKKYIEKTYRFHVLEHRAKGNRFVLSRVKIVEEERTRMAAKVREKLQVGAELEGQISSLTGFGAFVDLGGGLEGLVHVSELAHRAVTQPKDVVKKGQRVKVKVLKIEEEGKRISLSMKALEPDPWKEMAAKYPRGEAFTGKITGKTEFGVFVELEPGIEGLVHLSALPPGKTLEDEAFQPAKEVSGWIKEVDGKRRRISLSLREVATSDPWKGVEKRYPEGEVVTGRVEEVAAFGVFVNLEPGLTGLMPSSELKLPRGAHPGRAFPPGSEVKVQVGRIEPKRKRITLLPEGAKVEGSRTDYRDFKQKTEDKLGSGLTTLAAAFEKLKQRQDRS